MRDGDRDASAARAHVSDAEPGPRPSSNLHRTLHEDLGVRVGHEHVGRHLEFQAHELLVADEVGDRLAPGAPPDQAAIGAQLRLRQRAIELQVEVEAAHSKGVREEKLGIEARGIRTVLLKVVGGELQDLNDGQLAWASLPPFSCAVLSAAMSAETSSSRSPAMTRSSLCKVRLIRWSVTRLSLKL